MLKQAVSPNVLCKVNKLSLRSYRERKDFVIVILQGGLGTNCAQGLPLVVILNKAVIHVINARLENWLHICVQDSIPLLQTKHA